MTKLSYLVFIAILCFSLFFSKNTFANDSFSRQLKIAIVENLQKEKRKDYIFHEFFYEIKKDSAYIYGISIDKISKNKKKLILINYHIKGDKIVNYIEFDDEYTIVSNSMLIDKNNSIYLSVTRLTKNKFNLERNYTEILVLKLNTKFEITNTQTVAKCENCQLTNCGIIQDLNANIYIGILKDEDINIQYAQINH